MTTPSEPTNDLLKDSRPKLPASTIDLRTPNKPLGQTQPAFSNFASLSETQEPLPTQSRKPPPIPPREPPPIPRRVPPPINAAPKLSEQAKHAPPLPPRPKVKQNAQVLVANNENSEKTEASSPTFSTNDDEQTKPLLKPVPPTTLPVGKQEPQKVLPTPNEPVRHYIYQELICKVIILSL